MKKHITMVSEDVFTTLANGTTSLRDKALALVLAESGLRLGEIAGLDRTSITSKRHVCSDGTVQVFGRGETLMSKWGGSTRDFLIGPLAIAALDAYLTTLPSDDNRAPLFHSINGRRLDSRAVGNIVRKVIGGLGLPPIPASGFRYSLAARFVQAGLSADVVKKLLGYAGISCFETHVPLTQDALLRGYFLGIGSFPWYQKS